MNECGSHSVAFHTHQLERFDEADMADLPCRRLGHEQVLVLGARFKTLRGGMVRYALILWVPEIRFRLQAGRFGGGGSASSSPHGHHLGRRARPDIRAPPPNL